MVSDISKGHKDFGSEWKARVSQIKESIWNREVLDARICIQKCICNRSFPAREDIDKTKAKAANGEDILGKETFPIPGI
jgi:hypothetical protein